MAGLVPRRIHASERTTLLALIFVKLILCTLTAIAAVVRYDVLTCCIGWYSHSRTGLDYIMPALDGLISVLSSWMNVWRDGLLANRRLLPSLFNHYLGELGPWRVFSLGEAVGRTLPNDMPRREASSLGCLSNYLGSVA